MAVSLQSNPMNSATHIKPEPSQIPGLQHQIQDNEEKIHHRTDPQPSEEYYPWGRPGGGAPIRTVSGTLLTNYSTRGQEVERARSNVPQQPSLVHSSPQKPQFARGLGPHVDTFVLSQREEQRRKEQMHKVASCFTCQEQFSVKWNKIVFAGRVGSSDCRATETERGRETKERG